MKRKLSLLLAMIFVVISTQSAVILADDISLYNNNTMTTATYFGISSSGLATVLLDFEGYPNITTGATITIKIEKRNFLLFWSDVVDETISVVGDSYYKEHYYQLEDTGTYRCTVVYTVSGTGGADDVIPFEDTAKYE